MSDMNDFNQGVIEEFRANGGKVGGGFAGAPVVLLTTTGAKSGATRVNPLVALVEGDDLYVFASKAGAPTSPDWYHNLVANPQVEVETVSRPPRCRSPLGPSATACTPPRWRCNQASPSTRRPRRG
jgi:hypothetical protein